MMGTIFSVKEAIRCTPPRKMKAATAATAQSPYGGGDTSGKICTVLQNFDFSKPKIFYDGPVPEFDPQRSVLV